MGLEHFAAVGRSPWCGASGDDGRRHTVDASSETTVNGSWQLKVQDVYSADTGYINSWKLTF